MGGLRRGFEPRRFGKDEAKPDPKHLRPDPSCPSAPLIMAAASIDASFNVVRVPAPLEPFVAIGLSLIVPGMNPKVSVR